MVLQGELAFEIKSEWQGRGSLRKPGAQHPGDRELQMPSPSAGMSFVSSKGQKSKGVSTLAGRSKLRQRVRMVQF